jgi:hypothetical protein
MMGSFSSVLAAHHTMDLHVWSTANLLCRLSYQSQESPFYHLKIFKANLKQVHATALMNHKS